MDDEHKPKGTNEETEFSREVAAQAARNGRRGGTPRRASGSASE